MIRARSVVIRHAALGLFATLGSACAASHVGPVADSIVAAARVEASPPPSSLTSPTSASPTPLPPVARGVIFSLSAERAEAGAAEVSEVVRTGLAARGYHLVADERHAHDVDLRLDVHPTESVRDELQISIAVVHGGRTLQVLVTPAHANATLGPVVARLLDNLSSSKILESVATSVSERAMQAPKFALLGAGESPALPPGSAELSRAAIRNCRNTKRERACKPLVDYLAASPAGAQAADARRTLELVQQEPGKP